MCKTNAGLTLSFVNVGKYELPGLNFRTASFLLIAVIASIFVNSSQSRCFAQENSTWKGRFRQEAPVKWVDYLKNGENLQGSCVTTDVHVIAGKTQISQSRVEC